MLSPLCTFMIKQLNLWKNTNILGPSLTIDFVLTNTQEAHQHGHFYHKLRHFKMDSSFMEMFYSCFIESVLVILFAGIKQKPHSMLQCQCKIANAFLSNISTLHKADPPRKLKQFQLHLTIPCFIFSFTIRRQICFKKLQNQQI